MATIDLSKAKIGDKFRTRCGCILEYIGGHIDSYELMDKNNSVFYYHEKGNFLSLRESDYDLIEQVFDETLDTTERDERSNREMKEVVEEIEEDQELQRRKEVVELAERIFFSNRGNTYSFKECVEVAEHSVNIRIQYLKDGKLC